MAEPVPPLPIDNGVVKDKLGNVCPLAHVGVPDTVPVIVGDATDGFVRENPVSEFVQEAPSDCVESRCNTYPSVPPLNECSAFQFDGCTKLESFVSGFTLRNLCKSVLGPPEANEANKTRHAVSNSQRRISRSSW